mmetsp:Transcript_43340/g.76453  ORF Transcript_43340/g.76453 Transcript_43340/m.76453 type:complete len:114 (+) Transcript_43340:236-577(+)
MFFRPKENPPSNKRQPDGSLYTAPPVPYDDGVYFDQLTGWKDIQQECVNIPNGGPSSTKELYEKIQAERFEQWPEYYCEEYKEVENVDQNKPGPSPLRCLLEPPSVKGGEGKK